MSTLMWVRTLYLTLTLTQLSVDSFPVSDKIVSLPGQPMVSFQQFSGYVTVDEKQQRSLFYYFVEAENDLRHSKPLVLWLNGGPGCSSVGAGAFIEHGPFKPNAGDSLFENDYSWNKEANMLYLESPAGVGFSYSTNKSFYTTLNDAITAQDSLTFLQRWFTKFPEYKNRHFFIAGESYAGHYVPQLAQLIVNSKEKFNLKGIALGNPSLEFNIDLNSEDEYNWNHGVISDSSYELLTKVCNSSRFRRELTTAGPLSEECIRVFTQVLQEQTQYRNDLEYFVTGDVCLSSSVSDDDYNDQALNKSLYPALSMPNLDHLLPPSLKLQLEKAHHHHLNLHGHDDQQQVTHKYQKSDACAQQEVAKYLNRKDVHKAFHAQLFGVKQWNLCNRDVQYVVDQELPTILVVGSLVRSGIRVLVYSGDQDAVIPFFGTRRLVNRLAKDLGLETTDPYRAWFESKQIGGWTQVYGNNILSFATIRGASHTAPAAQPERSLLLFKSFLAGKSLPKA
ncbi:serine carboxypeptidase-like 45 [Ziziphus jujuba]|uniref:Carboxypeptidase n=1 Tax=Ziziphus jujuba TaxID=326968 RepID=A0A6P4ANS7_ZIZJJ|nr:serine carboxypeptidase-like 45 [Ziziphus jujuba]